MELRTHAKMERRFLSVDPDRNFRTSEDADCPSAIGRFYAILLSSADEFFRDPAILLKKSPTLFRSGNV
jgi:hypothetical protein